MSPLNIARETNYKREFRQYSLSTYKRSQSAEYTLLADPNFGEITMRRMLYAIDKQAELTMMDLISNAVVEYPYHEMLRRLQNPVTGFNHTREIMAETEDCFAGAKSHPDELLINIKMHINGTNKHNTVLGPAGFTMRLIKNAGTASPQPVESFRPYFDTNTRTVLVRAYAEGVNSIASFGGINMFEITRFKVHFPPMLTLSRVF